MIQVNIMYLLFVITWYVLFVIFFLFLYLKYKRPYYVSNIQKIYKNIPENLSPMELSMLLYRKITPNALSATITYLIEQGYIIREGNVLKKVEGELGLSLSQNSALEILFDVLGNGKMVDINKIDSFCDNNSTATDFLLAYDIWNNMAIREVNASKQFFVPKMDYELVKWFQYLGYFLVVLNVVLNCHYLGGYLIVFPAYFLLQYFYKISKRTRPYQKQFYQWLGFGNYLSEIKSKDEIGLNQTWVLVYSVLLNKIGHVENKIKEEQFYTTLDKALQKCHYQAVFFGNRKI